MFVYARNCPVTYRDPSGTSICYKNCDADFLERELIIPEHIEKGEKAICSPKNDKCYEADGFIDKGMAKGQWFKVPGYCDATIDCNDFDTKDRDIDGEIIIEVSCDCNGVMEGRFGGCRAGKPNNHPIFQDPERTPPGFPGRKGSY